MIRNASSADLSAITAIYNEVIATTNAIYREDPVDESERMAWFKEKVRDGYPVIVAEVDGQVVGYGVYGAFRFGEGYNQSVEHSVHVDVSHRGKGIGNLILETLIHTARLENRHVMVAAIDSTNEISITLHAAHGFVESARMQEIAIKHGVYLDLVLMQLNL
ncbi:MAG: N-acetyltransferase family protein [Actinomycetes bacterium]